jgi:hypothetical protein
MEEVLGAAILGFVTGLVLGTGVAIYGATKQKLGLGIWGFFACGLSGALLGLLAAGPVCAIFVYLIGKEKVPVEPAYK